MRALDNASINDQIDVNGGHQPTELESEDWTSSLEIREDVVKVRWCSEKVCGRESRKGWERRDPPWGCANDGGVNCRAVLKSYTLIGFCTPFFFTSSLMRNNNNNNKVNLHKIHCNEAKRPSGLVHRITALRFGMGR